MVSTCLGAEQTSALKSTVRTMEVSAIRRPEFPLYYADPLYHILRCNKHSLWLLKKALPSKEEPDISLSIVNIKARFYTHALPALLARSAVARSMILY